MARVYVTRQLPGTGLERLRRAHEVELWGGDGAVAPEALRAGVAEAEGLLAMLTDNRSTPS